MRIRNRQKWDRNHQWRPFQRKEHWKEFTHYEWKTTPHNYTFFHSIVRYHHLVRTVKNVDIFRELVTWGLSAKFVERTRLGRETRRSQARSNIYDRAASEFGAQWRIPTQMSGGFELIFWDLVVRTERIKSTTPSFHAKSTAEIRLSTIGWSRTEFWSRKHGRFRLLNTSSVYWTCLSVPLSISLAQGINYTVDPT